MKDFSRNKEYARAEAALTSLTESTKINFTEQKSGASGTLKRPWRSLVRNAYRENSEGGFAVCTPPLSLPIKERPLLIIIHPGDAIEDGIGYGDAIAAAEVVEFGRRNVIAMAREIDEKLATHDVVVLHRQSSIDTFMRSDFGQFLKTEKDIKPYAKMCIKASEQGQVLFGDDLDACAKWILENMNPVERPEIFMTGAYACAQWGCITHVGKCLMKAGCNQIEVSPHSPTDSSNYQPRWNPAGEPNMVKKQLRP